MFEALPWERQVAGLVRSSRHGAIGRLPAVYAMRISVLSILLGACLSFCFAAQARAVTASARRQAAEITTVGGRTFHKVAIPGVEPDDFVVS